MFFVKTEPPPQLGLLRGALEAGKIAQDVFDAITHRSCRRVLGG